jgi:AraC-like DNA-binding protein/ligand-binding sensor protein
MPLCFGGASKGMVTTLNEKLTEQEKTVGCGFDFVKARKEVTAYSSSTGMNCYIIDDKGNTVFQSYPDNEVCQYCRNHKAGFTDSFSCSDVYLYGSYQAERFGGSYIFFCPLGLTHWATPITEGHIFRGALIGGPVLMVEPEEFLVEDIADHGLIGSNRNEFTDFLKKVPVKQPEVVNNLSALLSILSSDISSGKDMRREEQNQFNSMQAQISESLQMIKSSKLAKNASIAYPFEKERELLRLISLGDKSASQKILNEILGYVFFSTGNDFELVKARVQELTVLLSRAAIEGGAGTVEIFGLNHQYLSEINNYKTIEELTIWLSRILARFTDCVFNLADVRHKDIIYKVNNYIKKNYMYKITLEEMARYVFLNPSYFSKIFKEEMKVPFVVYVNRLRIEISKNLLLDDTVPLTDVSSMVGFEEQSYFTKVFKKVTGMTPGLYRKSRGMPQPASSPQ